MRKNNNGKNFQFKHLFLYIIWIIYSFLNFLFL